MAIFGKKLGSVKNGNFVSDLVTQIESTIDPTRDISRQVTRAALTTESISDPERNVLSSTVSKLSTVLESVMSSLGVASERTNAQKEAAIAAGIMAADPKAYLSQDTRAAMVSMSTESFQLVPGSSMSGQATAQRAWSMEAYDESENRRAVQFSIAYNMQAARQDEITETLFPTIVVSPDNFGIEYIVRLMRVHDDRKRRIDGAVQDFAFKNLLRAPANPEILKNESTRTIPVVRPQNAASFVDPAVIPPYTISVEGVDFVTAPIKTGTEVDVLSLSATDALMATGAMDLTDSLDPTVRLTYLYARVGADVISFDVTAIPTANFVYAVQGNYRDMNLNFNTTSVLITKKTKQHDGSALVDLNAIVTNDYIVRLKIIMSGQVNIQTGRMQVWGNEISVSSIQDSNGNNIALTDPAVAAIVAAINSGSIIGYDQQSYRSNANRRERGQLIETTEFRYTVSPMLYSPISAMHPVTQGGETDTADLTTLITATRMRTTQAGIGALIRAANILEAYVDSRDSSDEGPEIFGVGRFYVRPTFFRKSIDMVNEIDSLRSFERSEDLQSVLVNYIRDFAYRMYRDSEYQVASDAIYGGESPKPTIIIATDPVICRYLMVTGDLRTLSNEFNFKIVNHIDPRLKGKIFITFGQFNGDINSSPNPLHFGNMAWKPELTLVMPISRNGQISKELAVQPNFIHQVNLPVLTVLEVSNIPNVLSKVPLNAHVI